MVPSAKTTEFDLLSYSKSPLSSGCSVTFQQISDTDECYDVPKLELARELAIWNERKFCCLEKLQHHNGSSRSMAKGT